MSKTLTFKLPMVEGHAQIIKRSDGKGYQYGVTETARFLQKSCHGQDIQKTHYIVYRICGMCPASHEEALFKSIEKIENLELTDSSKTLREIKRLLQTVKDSIFHYCHFAVPLFSRETVSFSEGKKRRDLHYLGTIYKEINEFAKDGLEEIKNHLGAASYKNIDFLENVDKVIEHAHSMLETYPPPSHLGTHHLELDIPMATLRGTKVVMGKGTGEISKIEFSDFIPRLGYTLENYALFEGQSLKTGPMARMYLLSNKENFFTPQVRPIIDQFKRRVEKLRPLDKLNPFDEHYLRVVEIIDCLEKVKILRNSIADEKKPVIDSKKITGRAYGYVEAPRGILIYRTMIEKGIIRSLSITTPTAFFIPYINSIIEHAKSEREAIEVIVAGNPCNACFEEQE